MPRRCSREAISGTTPPKRWCAVICEKTTFESSSSPPRTTAAAVSSHELSIPRMMGNAISLILNTVKQAATEIVSTLRRKGHSAYLVGGCVRDLLLGKEPADYDVATSATPDQVVQYFPQTYPVGAQFGVILVEIGNKDFVEVATFRSDVSYSDGRQDLQRMRREAHPRGAFELMDETGLRGGVLHEIGRMKGVKQPPQFHPEGDVWVHTLMLLEQLPAGVSPTLALGALLHDVGKPATFRVAPDRIRFDGHVEVGEKVAAQILRRLRLSNDETTQVLALVANHMRFADVTKMKDSTLKRFSRLPRFDEHLELPRMDCTASHGKLDLYDFTRQKLAETPPAEIRPAPLVTGNDLIDVGYEPGPRFKEILEAVEDAQLEGRLQSREEALHFVAREFPLAG